MPKHSFTGWMMRRLFFIPLAGLLFLVPLPSLHAAERVITVEGYNVNYSPFYDGPMLVNSKAKKLYCGRGYSDGEYDQGLYVYDISADGEITGTDERILPNSPDPVQPPPPGGGPTYYFRVVYGIAVSPDGRKLYLGLCGCRNSEAKPLVVYDLDEKGEPTGKPRSYEIAKGLKNIQSLLLHPKGNVIYTVASSTEGICSIPLVDGEPSMTATNFAIGSVYNYQLIPNDTFDKLLVPGYPSRVQLVTVGASGGLESKDDLMFNVGEPKAWLAATRVDHTLFFALDNKLWSWTLDKDWHPVGKPVVHADIPALRVMNGVQSSLYVVLGEFDHPKGAKEPVFVSSRVARYKPDAQGKIGKPEFLSDIFSHKRVMNLTVDESSGVIYVSTWPN